MKKRNRYLLFLGLALVLSSCGGGTAFITNHNQNITEVHLNRNNFKFIDQVSASSEATYVLGLGNMRKNKMYENAYSAMMKKANLLNTSRAVVNVMTEEHFSGFVPFYVKRTITVSAMVVEFTD